LLAERIRHAVESMPFKIPGDTLTITISIGVAMQAGEMSGIDDMLRNADMAMYNAKHRGGNCVIRYENISDEKQRLR
jgi:diguanylate cyclase (GGDEF)-like protein